MTEARYLTAVEAAERLGVSLRTVRRRLADGSLAAVKLGGAVRIPESALDPRGAALPPARSGAAGHVAREAAVAYEAGGAGAAVARDAAYVRAWNREHWPDSWEAMLHRRRQAFAELDEIRRHTRPPAGPHDTADAFLREERDALGARLLPDGTSEADA